jgi:hypothetical protein
MNDEVFQQMELEVGIVMQKVCSSVREGGVMVVGGGDFCAGQG